MMRDDLGNERDETCTRCGNHIDDCLCEELDLIDMQEDEEESESVG